MDHRLTPDLIITSGSVYLLFNAFEVNSKIISRSPQLSHSNRTLWHKKQCCDHMD